MNVRYADTRQARPALVIETCAVQEGMSALPPKADMCGAT